MTKKAEKERSQEAKVHKQKLKARKKADAEKRKKGTKRKEYLLPEEKLIGVEIDEPTRKKQKVTYATHPELYRECPKCRRHYQKKHKCKFATELELEETEPKKSQKEKEPLTSKPSNPPSDPQFGSNSQFFFPMYCPPPPPYPYPYLQPMYYPSYPYHLEQ